MKDETKSKEQLSAELAEMRQRVATLEAAETERVRAEREIEERRMYLEGVLGAAPDAIVTLDAQHRIVEWNPGAESLFGYSRPEVIGQNIDHLITNPDTFEEAVGLSQVIITSEKDVPPAEMVRYRKDGSPVDVIAAGSPILIEDELIGIVAVYTDISERKRAEEALRESEERFRAIFETAQDSVFIKDRTQRYTLVNPAMEKLFELPASKLIGLTDEVIFGKEAGAHIKEMDSRVLNGECIEEEDSKPVKGIPTTFHVIKTPMRDNSGEIVGLCGIARDVTERVRAEQALRESNRRLEETLAELREAQKQLVQQERLAAVGQLAAGIAHGFNNMMTPIICYSDMMLNDPDLGPKDREKLTAIRQQGCRAADLTQQILDFGRQAILRRRELNLVPFMEGVKSLLASTLPENIRLHLSYTAGEMRVDVDPARLQQAVVNLALNARDAMPEGGDLHIGLDRVRSLPPSGRDTPQEEGREWVRLTVMDTGTGIPADVLPHIFEPFFSTRIPERIGLGLSQVHGIVKQHGGHIEVDTRVGEGTQFSIYLPAQLATRPERPAPPAEELALAQGQGETILVVEDDTTVRAALMDVLEMLNYRPLEAKDGREALTVIKQHKGDQGISLVLCDWVMPVMEGVELVRELQQQHRAVKVVILTGHSLDQETKARAPESVVGWAQKPPRLEQLAQVVARAMAE